MAYFCFFSLSGFGGGHTRSFFEREPTFEVPFAEVFVTVGVPLVTVGDDGMSGGATGGGRT